MEISDVTAEQRELLPVIRQEWIPLGWSTAPADRPAAEEALARAYELARLKPPLRMVWVDSPLAARLEVARLRIQRQRLVSDVDEDAWRVLLEHGSDGRIDRSLLDCGESVLNQITEAVEGHVIRRVRGAVAPGVRIDVTRVMRQFIGDRIWCEAYRRFTDPIYEVLGGHQALTRPIRDVIYTRGGQGQHGVSNLAMHAFFAAIGVIEETRSLDSFRRLARSCGAWWAFENVAILTERPRVLVLDDRERLHSDSGPALEYPDGFGFDAWHGVTDVPDSGIDIDVDSLTPQRIDAESNGSLRATLIDLYGTRRYLEEKGAKLIHEENHWGALYHTTDRESTALLHMDSALWPVAVSARTGREAWALLAGDDPKANDDCSTPPMPLDCP